MTADSGPAAISNAAPPGYRYAGAWIRLAALIIDSLLVALFWVVLAALHPAGPDSVRIVFHPHEYGSSTLALVHGVKIGVMLGWLAGWQAAVGATPGMMLLRLRVLGPSREAKPSLRAAVIRNSVIMLGSVGPILANAGINAVLEIAALLIHLAIGITISKAPTRQGIHDRLAGGTYVVRRVPASTNTR